MNDPDENRLCPERRSSPGAPPARARRLFFALWPDAPMREALTRAVRKAVRASGGRPVPPAQYHVTLAFLGAVPESRVAEFGAVARAATAPATVSGPIQVPLQALVHWPGPRVLCVVPCAPLRGLGAWVGRLFEALVAAGFAPDLKPFHPHVTVARKVTRPSASAAPPPVLWAFESFALIESRTLQTGPVYSVVETYPLFNGTLSAK